MVVGTDTVAVLPEVVVTVSGLPPLMVYVNVYGAVPDAPVKVTSGEDELRQTDVVPLMVAVGRGLTGRGGLSFATISVRTTAAGKAPTI